MTTLGSNRLVSLLPKLKKEMRSLGLHLKNVIMFLSRFREFTDICFYYLNWKEKITCKGSLQLGDWNSPMTWYPLDNLKLTGAQKENKRLTLYVIKGEMVLQQQS